MKLLETIDRYLGPQIIEIEEYINDDILRRPSGLLCGYHSDFGGIPWQAALNRMYGWMWDNHENGLASHYITFESPEPWLELYEKKTPYTVLFGDFEPHATLLRTLNGVESMGIFGHHPREDVDAAATRKTRYFNTRHHLPDKIQTDDGKEYERGVPVLYPMLKAAEMRGADVNLIGSLGLRGYGYRRLAEEWEEERGITPHKPEQTVEAITLLFAHKFGNCDGIVKRLTEADDWSSEELSHFRLEALYQQLFDRRDDAVAYALHHKAEFDGLAVWPIRSAFQQMQPMIFELQRKQGRRYDSHIFLNLGGKERPATNVKGSMRTSLELDWNEILEKAWPAELPRNWGGQKKAAGFVVRAQSARTTVKRIIEEATQARGKRASINESETDRLLGIELPEKQRRLSVC